MATLPEHKVLMLSYFDQSLSVVLLLPCGYDRGYIILAVLIILTLSIATRCGPSLIMVQIRPLLCVYPLLQYFIVGAGSEPFFYLTTIKRLTIKLILTDAG